MIPVAVRSECSSNTGPVASIELRDLVARSPYRTAMSDDSIVNTRLDQINTRWSLVRRAHNDPADTGTDARKALVLRYSGAVRKYIGAMTRNEEETDELSQDVVVRLLNGDFSGANPNRGRFRDLLKVAVRNMVRNYWEKKGRRAGVDYDVSTHEEAADDETGPWEDVWTGNVLNLVWGRLQDYERTHEGSMAWSVLRLRADNPDDSSEQLAVKLSARCGHPVKADTTRQHLRRARVRFAEMLIEELADSIDQPNADRIEEELVALGLLEHVRGVLPANWKVQIESTRGPHAD